MEVKELLTKISEGIKQMFDAMPAPATSAPADMPPSPTTNKYTTSDGTVIEVEALEVGKPVIINGSPAPAGDYTLEDGTAVSIDEAGMIASVTPPPVEAPAAPEFNADAKFAAYDEKFTAYEQKFENQAKLINAQSEELKKQKEAFEKTAGIVNQLFQVVQKLAAQPLEAPIQAPQGAAFSKDNIVSILKTIK